MRYQMYTREKPLQRPWSGSKAIFLTLINFLLSSSHLREYFSPWQDLKPQHWLLTIGGPWPRPRRQNLPILRQVTNLPRDTARKPTIDHWRFWHPHVFGAQTIWGKGKKSTAVHKISQPGHLSSGKGQARIGGLKPLPRACTKVGCHPPTTSSC